MTREGSGYDLVLADRKGRYIGEFDNAKDRKLTWTLNKPATVAMTIRPDHPLAFPAKAADKTLCQAYEHTDDSDEPVLRFQGPGTLYDKLRSATSPPGTIALTYTDPAWWWLFRYLGMDKAGVTWGTPAGMLDRSYLLSLAVDLANQIGDTGIRFGTMESNSKSFVGPVWAKQVAELVNDLAIPLDGFDWWIDPLEAIRDMDQAGVVGEGLALGQLNCLPVRGTYRPDAVFEYGLGKRNVSEWRDTEDPTTLGNDVWNLPSSWPDNATQNPVNAKDPDSIADRGIYQAIVTQDLVTDDLRNRLVQQHRDIRKVPRETITFLPVRDTAKVPRFKVDYDIGDIVPFRAREEFPVIDRHTGATVGTEKVITVDALFRVYKVELALDDAGSTSPTITLVPSEVL